MASPTIFTKGKVTAMQTIASHKFLMQLGDVTGAFLESDDLMRKKGKVYISQQQKVACLILSLDKFSK